MVVIVQLPFTFSKLTVAVVAMRFGVKPAPPRAADNAMLKQPACAAAINSSGLVPVPFSKRVLKEYCVSLRTVLAVEIVPLPCLRSPCQTADAERFIMDKFGRNERRNEKRLGRNPASPLSLA